MYYDRKAVRSHAVKPSFNDYEWTLIEKLCAQRKMQPATLVHALAVEAIEGYLNKIDDRKNADLQQKQK